MRTGKNCWSSEHGRNSNLDELAEAARLEPGDAKKAWQLLATHTEGTNLPAWVKAYVQKSVVAVAAYDIENGDQAKLAHDLGFTKRPRSKTVGATISTTFRMFTDRMMKDVQEGKKISISRTAREYLEERRMFDNSPDGARKAYEKGPQASRRTNGSRSRA